MLTRGKGHIATRLCCSAREASARIIRRAYVRTLELVGKCASAQELFRLAYTETIMRQLPRQQMVVHVKRAPRKPIKQIKSPHKHKPHCLRNVPLHEEGGGLVIFCVCVVYWLVIRSVEVYPIEVSYVFEGSALVRQVRWSAKHVWRCQKRPSMPQPAGHSDYHSILQEEMEILSRKTVRFLQSRTSSPIVPNGAATLQSTHQRAIEREMQIFRVVFRYATELKWSWLYHWIPQPSLPSKKTDVDIFWMAEGQTKPIAVCHIATRDVLSLIVLCFGKSHCFRVQFLRQSTLSIADRKHGNLIATKGCSILERPHLVPKPPLIVLKVQFSNRMWNAWS